MAGVIEKLQSLIAEGRIIFDTSSAARLKDELLGRNAGTRISPKAQALVCELCRVAPGPLRISSIVRDAGHHGEGRAVDIGNEEVAEDLLPLVATDARVTELGIDEIIFDANIAGEDDRNKWNYDRGLKHDYNTDTLSQHGNHIHFAVREG
jgi:hypothetical protein